MSHLPLTRVLALGAIGFAAFVGEGAVEDWSAIYARDSLGAGAGAAAVAVAAFGVAMAVARFTGDRATSRFGPVRLVGAGGAVAATGYALVVAVPHLAAVYAGFALVGLGLGAVVPVAFSASGHAGRARPRGDAQLRRLDRRPGRDRPRRGGHRPAGRAR